MDACPYCDFDLNGPPHRHANRALNSTGGKSHIQELVSCPNCGGIIDGFAKH